MLAQAPAPGPQVLTWHSSVDDSDQPYGIYIPKNFDPARRYPLVIGLHGAGSNHRLDLRRIFGKGNLPGQTDAEASRVFPPFKDVDYLVATPLARGTIGYQGLGERDVYAVLDDVKRRFPVDEDRVYLTGLSMGGGGALWLALTRPDVWAGVAAVCPAVPGGAEELAGNALNIPVHLFQGALDPVVPVSSTRGWHKRLVNLETNVEYIEYPVARHNSWDQAYAGARIFDWFSKYKRNRYPDHVRYAARHYAYRQAYWLEIDGLEPGRPAAIDARFESRNRLTITTQDLDGFTLRLAGHPQYRASEALRVTIDGVAQRPQTAGLFAWRKTAKGWEPGQYAPGAAEKREGSEGPILAGVSRRQIYVYGTLDSPNAAELERRKAEAVKAHDWSVPASRALFSPQVAADAQVKEADIAAADLVLFGTRQTNSLIERWADRIPVELNPGAADYGLLVAASLGDRMMLVSSGLPWWTVDHPESRNPQDFLPLQIRLLVSFRDYILFRRSLDTVVAEGYFDRNWKLPAGQAAKMQATGAVSLH